MCLCSLFIRYVNSLTVHVSEKELEYLRNDSFVAHWLVKCYIKHIRLLLCLSPLLNRNILLIEACENIDGFNVCNTHSGGQKRDIFHEN